jgi:hypothetical protein
MRISIAERGCLGPDREGIAFVLINSVLDSLIPVFLRVPVVNPLQVRVEGMTSSPSMDSFCRVLLFYRLTCLTCEIEDFARSEAPLHVGNSGLVSL